MRLGLVATLALVLAFFLVPPAAHASGGDPRIDVLLEQAEAARSSDPEAFSRSIGEINSLIGAASEQQRERVRYLKAYQLAYAGRYDLAIAESERLIRESGDPVIRFRAGALAANSAAATRDFVAGLRYMEESLSLINEVGDRDLRHSVLLVAAILYNQIGQYAPGLDYAERILADQPDGRNRCYAAHLRLEAKLHLGALDDSAESMLASAADCESNGEIIGANLIRLHLARHWVANGEGSMALSLLQEHLDQAREAKYPRILAEFHALLSEINQDLGALDAAEAHARQAITASVGITNSLPVVQAESVLYRIARSRGRMEEALDHYIRFAEADKAYLDDVKARELAYQMSRHDAMQKAHTIQLLNGQNQVLQLEQKIASEQARNTQLALALVAVLAATLGFWAWRTKQSQVSFRRLAQTDALTGIANRLHFTRKAEEALAYCRKSGQDVGLVMFDLDEFKGINDRYGHAAGDYVLKAVAEACSQACRKGDLIGRLGGEEFALLLVGCDLAASVSIAQQCRERIARIETSVTGDHFRVTASFGVAGSREGGHDFLTLLRRADDALYRAKREGRDRVIVDGREDVAPATA